MKSKTLLTVAKILIAAAGTGVTIAKVVEKGKDWNLKHSQKEKWVKRRENLHQEEMKFKEEELDLQNKKHAERTKTDCEIKKSYESTENDGTDDFTRENLEHNKSVKESICRLLKIGVYCPPRECKMLEDNEKTTIHVKPTPLVGDMIKLGDRVVIAGTPGAGKSTLVHQLADDISCGKESKLLPKGSGFSKGQPVFLFDSELDSDDRMERDGRATFNDRLIRMDDFSFPTVYYALDDAYNRVMNLNEDATIIYDNLYAMFPTMTSDQTKDLLEGFEKIQKLAGERGVKITFIIITHTTKDFSGVPEMSDIAGSANLSRFARSVYILAATKHNGEAILVNTKCRHSGKNDISVLNMATEPLLHLEFKKSISFDEAKKLMKSQGGAESLEGENINPKEEFAPGRNYTLNVIEEVIKLKNEGVSFRKISEYMKAKGVSMSHTTAHDLYVDFTPKEELTPAVA